MPNTRVLNRSFGGGELSPEMYGRIDDSKYQSGAAVMRNFIASPQGPAENRAGFALVREVKDSSKKTRVISFTFSTVQTMVIEVGEGYFRFHTQGQTLIIGTATAWNSGTAYQVGDLASLSGSNYYCTADNTNQTPPNASYWYLIPTQAYEVPHPYLEDELFDIKFVQSADVLTLVHPNHKPRELRRLGATKWVVTEINFGTPISAPTGAAATRYIPASASINVDTYETMRYQVTAVSTDLINESGVSNTASVDNNIFVSGAKNTINWSAVTGASRYNVYKYQGGVYGYIGSSTTTSIEDNNIAPDFSKTPPIFDNDFVSGGNYPGAVSYFEQRRCFAGTINEPQKIWMTKSGTESNMSYSLPVQDDNRIEFKVAAREANTIRHIVPLTELLLLTGSAEWRVTSVNSDAITPTSISVRPQSYIGASNVQPAIINNSMVYAAARGGHVRELGYNWQSNGFATNDLSLRAAHLFDNKAITDMAFSKAPIPIVWMTSTDGKLLGLTYVPEQQVGAWHRHDTDGTFESVAVVAEGSEDILYAVIKRHINGSDVRFIERLQSRQFDLPEDAFFVDCGSTYDGNNTTSETMTVTGGTLWNSSETLTITSSQAIFNAPPSTSDKDDVVVLADADGNKYRCKILTTTSTTVATVQVDNTLPVSLRGVATTSWAMARNEISGLGYLEGKTVNILATGAVHPQRVVTGGKITLDRAAAKIHIGLPIQADLQTLPLAINIEAYGQGRYKNINHVWLRVFQSSGIFVGPDPANLVEAKQRTNEPYGSPPALKSEDIKIMLTPSWQDEGQIYVRQSDPLPLTIVGLTIEVAIGG
jgi:hypothetical protein